MPVKSGAVYSANNPEGSMFNLGWTEILIILGVAVLIFGPKKLPELGSTFGKTLRGFKAGMEASQKEEDPQKED
jgi:sec-independent protein translocase protein TatA